MMGRRRLEELKAHAQALMADGHAEGRMLDELARELDRLRAREWTAERLHDAFDTLMALWLSEPEGRKKGLGGTSVLELLEWSAQRLREAVTARAEQSDDRGWTLSRSDALFPPDDDGGKR